MIDLFLTLMFILVLSRIFGELMERRRLPVIVGEIVIGLILGPPVLGLIEPGPEFKVIVDLSLFFIIFTTGMEFSLDHVKRNIRRSLFISLMGNNIAFFGGIFIALVLGFDIMVALFIGCVFSLTALPVALRILNDLGAEKTPLGRLVISSSIMDDLFSVILLSFILPLALTNDHSIWNVLLVISKMVFFLFIVFAINRFLQWRNETPSRFIMHYIRKFHSREAEFTIVLMVGLALAFLGELLGVTFIIGAFYAGAIIGENVIGRQAYQKVNSNLNTITFGFFGPLFFAYIGMNFIDRNFWLESSINETVLFLIFALLLIVLAFFSKAIGSYFGARLANIKKHSAQAVGLAMNSRGLMGLVIADIGYELNIIDKEILSLLIIMSIATTLMTPFFLKWFLKKNPSALELEKKPESAK